MTTEKETLQRVQGGLYHLRRGLAPFVEARMKARHGGNWLHYASRAQGGSPGAALDEYGLLKTMIDNWRDVFEDAYNYMKSGQLIRQVVNKINDVDFNDLAERQHFGDIYEQILTDLQSAGNAGEYYTPRAVTAFMADRIDPRPGEILFDPACGTGGFLT